jgi:hypothetical protein
MSELNVEFLETSYPRMAQALRKMVFFDKQADDWLNKKYGSNSIDYIVALNDYNKLAHTPNDIKNQ